MKIRLILIFIISVLFIVTSQAAIYEPIVKVPSTAVERKKMAEKLETEYQQKKDSKLIAQLAILYTVIAGLDEHEKPVVEKAIKLLAEARKANSSNYELMAAHGSVITMMASFSGQSSAKALRAAKKGFRLMDRALKNAPDDVGALLQRGNNSLKVPPFLRRLRYAERDFKKILELMKIEEIKPVKALALFMLGEVANKRKDPATAKSYWQQAAAMNVPGWSDKANRKLKQ
jgi:tetratricopeptide (TPR) repeat protein